jgi:hypothetical protein
MKTSAKVLIVTLACAILAFFLGPVIWTPSPEAQPTPGQIPFFIVLSVLESVSFGLGISFLFFGWPWVKRVNAPSKNLAVLTYLSISWMLINWWPHDSLHIHNAMNMQGLLYIEYGFHFTLIAAAMIVARYFLLSLQKTGKLK